MMIQRPKTVVYHTNPVFDVSVFLVRGALETFAIFQSLEHPVWNFSFTLEVKEEKVVNIVTRFYICETTVNKQCERILIWSAWWTDFLQLGGRSVTNCAFLHNKMLATCLRFVKQLGISSANAFWYDWLDRQTFCNLVAGLYIVIQNTAWKLS